MIEILLATFNGEKFLRQQLQSLEDQTCSNWKIIASDDGSTDGTVAILREFERCNPGRIEIHLNDYGFLGLNSRGAVSNFSRLLRFSTAKYVAFCDQDDVWVSTKLEKSLNALKQVESSFGEVPVLVHTDLAIVDENLNQLYSSMAKAQKLNCEANNIRQVIVQNCVTGCSMMANRALIKMVGFVPNEAIMHDWWFAIAAAAFGRLQFLNEPLVLYRQHSANEIGAKVFGFGGGKPKLGSAVFRLWFSSLVFVFRKLCLRKKTKRFVFQTFEQSRVFLRTYRRRLSLGQKKVLHDYCSIGIGNKFARIKKLILGGFLKRGFLRKIWQFIYI